MNKIFTDIETVPSQNETVVKEISERHMRIAIDAAAEVRAPINYKDPEKIAQWYETIGQGQRAAIYEKAKKDADEEYRSQSFDAADGEVYCVAAAVNMGAPEVWSRHTGLTEHQILVAFSARLNAEARREGGMPCIVGHFIEFDRTFIRQRCIVHRIKLPTWFTADVKPWDTDRVACTMKMWCGQGRRDRISLDKLCRTLGIAGKGDGIDGSKVWDAVQAGQGAEVAAYCAADVERARGCFIAMGGVVS